MTEQTSRRAVLSALLANLLICGGKTAAAVLSRSAAMLAAAIHSIGDTFSQLLLFFGVKKCEKRADELHPFAFSLDSYFWTFIFSILLYTAGALCSITLGIFRLRHPRPLTDLPQVITVLLLGLIITVVALHGTRKKIKKEKGNSGTFAYLQRRKKSELVVLFLQELASIAAMLIAAILLTLGSLSGRPFYDGLAAILTGALLAVLALYVGLQTKSLLIGESADPQLLRQIYQLIRQEESINRVIHLRSLQLGPDDVLLAIKVEFDPRLNTDQIASLDSVLEKEIRLRFPPVKHIYIEPAFFDAIRQPRLS